MSYSEGIVAIIRGLSLRIAAFREIKILLKILTKLTLTIKAATPPLHISKIVVMISRIILKKTTRKTRTSMVITMVTGRIIVGTIAKIKLLIMLIISRLIGLSKRLKSLSKSVRIIIISALVYRFKLYRKKLIS